MSAFWDKLKKDGEEKKTEEKKVDSSATENLSADKAGKEKKEVSKKDSADKKVEKKSDKKKGKKSKKKSFPKEKAQLIERIIVAPKVSESALAGQAVGKYVFFVSTVSTKNEIAKAVEAMYGVTVQKVNVLRYSPQSHSFRGHKGMKKGYKKAIVTLKKGDSINVFSE